MNIRRNRSSSLGAAPEASATLAMLNSVLEQFYPEYARNREAGVPDQIEAMCLALARVLPDDGYMPVMKMLSGQVDKAFPGQGSFAGRGVRAQLIKDGEEYWKNNHPAMGRTHTEVPSTRSRSSAARR